MFDKIATMLYVLTAIAAATCLTTLIVLTEIEGPMWVAVMAGLGMITTFMFAVLLLAALIFAGFVAINNAANRKQALKELQEVIHNNQPL